ncbi:DUF2509 family protein [Sodalis sp.]|uniref:DUF2509 family protein n=1 Tax=Sodalis sp. (in: enterobacteria) TaxID=1898979 RepID=UPI003873259A
MSRERGSGSVLALALLSGFCLLAMLSWQRALQVSLELARAQRHYLQAFHQAESSLAWGLSQHWPAWHGECRQHPTAPLRVCLQVSGRGYGWLLRGEGGGTILAPPLRHYRRVTLHLAVATAAEDPVAAACPTAPRDPAGVEPPPAPAASLAEGASPDRVRRYFLRARHDGWLDFDPG